MQTNTTIRCQQGFTWDNAVEMAEFYRLVNSIKPLKLATSAEVSKYIMQHRLGHQYPHISGFVEFEREGHRWEFAGGFPAQIYRRLCEVLKLKRGSSVARVVGFTSFAQFQLDL